MNYFYFIFIFALYKPLIMNWKAKTLLHKGTPRIAVYFEKNTELIARIKTFEDAREDKKERAENKADRYEGYAESREKQHRCAGAARRSSGYPLAQLEYRRDAHAARHNGGVAGFTVRFRGKPQDHARCLTKQIAGVKQLCRQDAGLRQVQTAAGAAIQNIHHAAAGIAHIHAALPDVIIIHVF